MCATQTSLHYEPFSFRTMAVQNPSVLSYARLRLLMQKPQPAEPRGRLEQPSERPWPCPADAIGRAVSGGETSESFTERRPFRRGPLNSLSVAEVNTKGKALSPQLALQNVGDLKDKCCGKLWVWKTMSFNVEILLKHCLQTQFILSDSCNILHLPVSFSPVTSIAYYCLSK